MPRRWVAVLAMDLEKRLARPARAAPEALAEARGLLSRVPRALGQRLAGLLRCVRRTGLENRADAQRRAGDGRLLRSACIERADHSTYRRPVDGVHNVDVPAMKTLLIAGTAAVMLTGCQTPEQQRQALSDEMWSRCGHHLGHNPDGGSDAELAAYSACIQAEYAAYEAEQSRNAAIGMALMGYGAQMQSRAAPQPYYTAPPAPQPPVTCTSIPTRTNTVTRCY
jgi:hypothetical protein